MMEMSFKDSNSRPHKPPLPQARVWTKKADLMEPVPPQHLASLLSLHSSKELVDHVPRHNTESNITMRERERD